MLPKLSIGRAKMMLAVVAVSSSICWCTSRASAAGGVYHVERQDFAASVPPAPRRPVGYQNLVNGNHGVYKVSRQEFAAGNAPFAQNGGPVFGDAYGYYPYREVANGHQRPFEPAPATLAPSLPPRLFVPAIESANNDGTLLHLPNYQQVLSLSEYNRRFEQSPPSYSQPPPSYSQPPPPLNPYWVMSGTSAAALAPPTTTPSLTTAAPSPATTPPPASSWTAGYSPSSHVPAGQEDDGILPPIPATDDENKPLPPISGHDSPRKMFVTESQDAAGSGHTKVKYHSFNDFVEISDEHRELLESFGSIQNNESDFSELPEATPIRRRRRNASYSQLFSLFSVREMGLGGTPQVARRDPQQLIDSYANRLWQQIKALRDMKRALINAEQQQQQQQQQQQRWSAKSPPNTIVAADDSTVIVFSDGSENFGSKPDDQSASHEEASRGLPRSPLVNVQPVVVESVNETDSNHDSLSPSKEINGGVERSTAESESRRDRATSTLAGKLSDAPDEMHLEGDERTGTHPTSDPRDQIIYLPEEKFDPVTHDSIESWEDLK